MKQVQTSATEVTTAEFKDFTGWLKYQVVAVNPSLEELHELGLTFFKEEPEYTRVEKVKDSSGNEIGEEKTSHICTFWLKDMDNIKDAQPLTSLKPLTFFVGDVPNVSMKNPAKPKYQFINSLGRTCWEPDIESARGNQYFVDAEVFECTSGMESLAQFCLAWMNIPDNVEYFEIEDFDAWTKGDFSMIKSSVIEHKDFVVRVLTGMRPNVTQTEDGVITKWWPILYNKFFGKHSTSVRTVKNYVEKVAQDGKSYNAFSTKKNNIVFSYENTEFIAPEDAPQNSAIVAEQPSQGQTQGSEDFGDF